MHTCQGSCRPMMVLVAALLVGWGAPAAGARCGQCDFVDMVEFPGGDLLPEAGAPRPAWWAGEWKMEGVAPVLETKEACCSFCTEWNRHHEQPPCVVATYTLAPQDVRKLCFPKGPAHAPKVEGTTPRIACTPGPPCAAPWGGEFLLVAFVGVGLYVSGGVALAVRLSGAVPRLHSHPHHQQWCEVAALVSDGIALSRARLTGRAAQQPRGGDQTAPLVWRRDDTAKGESGSRSKTEKAKKHRKEKAPRKQAPESEPEERREAAPPPALEEAPMAGTSASGGGRWVHVPT